jgi:nucleotide-binding universal stress UspA family protein
VTVLVWITEGTWHAAVDAARTHAPADADIVLLHVTGDDIAHGAFAGLLGRGHRERDPGTQLEAMAANAAADLLTAAAQRLDRPHVNRQSRHGRIEREVVKAADDADLLICARDGDHHLGPRSLGPATRFVVNHAPCPVLLVWPHDAPAIGTLPPPPGPHQRAPNAVRAMAPFHVVAWATDALDTERREAQ